MVEGSVCKKRALSHDITQLGSVGGQLSHIPGFDLIETRVNNK